MLFKPPSHCRQEQRPPSPALVARQFLRLIIAQARHATRGKPEPGCLQLCTLTGDDTVFDWKRFGFDQTEELIEHALYQAERGRNVYIEGRTIRRDAVWRGKMHESCWVFALVIDSDGDKARAWAGDIEASLVVETSPGNRQYWFFLDEAIIAEEARAIGAGMRAVTKTDSDTGVPVQPYRVAGLPNFPNSKKRARGRTVSPTHILAHSGGREGLWTADELQRRFPPPPSVGKRKAAPLRRAPSLPASGLTPEAICARYGVGGHLRAELLHGRPGGEDRSRAHYKFACELHERGVPAADALVLLTYTAFNKHADDAPVQALVEKIWSR
jgi:hypothetical protein